MIIISNILFVRRNWLSTETRVPSTTSRYAANWDLSRIPLPGSSYRSDLLQNWEITFSTRGVLLDSYTNMFCFTAINVVDKTVKRNEKQDISSIPLHSQARNKLEEACNFVPIFHIHWLTEGQGLKGDIWDIGRPCKCWDVRQYRAPRGAGQGVRGVDWPCQEQNSVRNNTLHSSVPRL